MCMPRLPSDTVNPPGQKLCLLFILESPRPAKHLGTSRCSEVAQMIMKVGLKDPDLKAREYSSNLGGSLHCAPGARLEASGVTCPGNRAHLRFWKCPPELFSGLLQNECSVLDSNTAAASLPPVSGPLPECNCTGCCERKPELNKALAASGGPAEPFLTC